jgi:hypothetical protein
MIEGGTKNNDETLTLTKVEQNGLIGATGYYHLKCHFKSQ